MKKNNKNPIRKTARLPVIKCEDGQAAVIREAAESLGQTYSRFALDTLFARAKTVLKNPPLDGSLNDFH